MRLAAVNAPPPRAPGWFPADRFAADRAAMRRSRECRRPMSSNTTAELEAAPPRGREHNQENTLSDCRLS